jgi:hypothetical protein
VQVVYSDCAGYLLELHVRFYLSSFSRGDQNDQLKKNEKTQKEKLKKNEQAMRGLIVAGPADISDGAGHVGCR